MADDNSLLFLSSLIQSLRSKNSNVRYHTQFALRRFGTSNPSVFFTEINKFLNTCNELNPKLINELSNILGAINKNDDTYVGQLHLTLQNIQRLCFLSEKIAYEKEIIQFAHTFFSVKPNLFNEFKNKSSNVFLIVTLAATKMDFQKKQKLLNAFLSEFFNYPTDNIYQKYAQARFVATFMTNTTGILPEYQEKLLSLGQEIVLKFIDSPVINFAPFIPSIVGSVKLEESSRVRAFSQFVKLNHNMPSISLYMVPSAVAITDHSEHESIVLLESLTPALSVIPFHFSQELPDDATVSGFNCAVRALESLITEENAVEVTNYLVKGSKSGDVAQRVGFQYALTGLVKLKAPIRPELLKPCFKQVQSAIEAGSLAELALALLGSMFEVMTWMEMALFFEQCLQVSNGFSEQFVIDAASLLGRFATETPEAVFSFIDRCVTERFQYASIHFAILESFVESRKLSIRTFPASLTVSLCVYIAEKGKVTLFKNEPLLKDPLAYLETVDANVHSEPMRVMLSRSNLHAPVLVKFLASVTWKCNKQEASMNALCATPYFQADLVGNAEDIAGLYAAYSAVDCQSATQSLMNLLSSQQRSWLSFGSSPKNGLAQRIIFQTLSKIRSNIIPFIQFASEHLPEPTDEELCKYVLCVLADVFRRRNDIMKEFPPKCRLFDFVTMIAKEGTDDVYRCIGKLVAIPPIGQVEHIPICTNLMLSAKELSEDLMFMTRQVLTIAQTPSHIELIIEPFEGVPTDSVQFNLFLAILESLVGRKHEEEDDFQTLGLDVSAIFDSSVTSFDGFLSLISRLVGKFIPVFESAHTAVEMILQIMARLTQKIEVKAQLSLHEAVKCIGTSFNSQCLFIVADRLCENMTTTSVTAFLVLFNERESELLHSAQLFVKKLLDSHADQASMMFNGNETLAKAATALVGVEHFDVLKSALKFSPYRKQITGILLEQPAAKAEQISMIVKDREIRDLLDLQSAEVQFAMIVTNPNYSSEISPSESKKFLELVRTNIENFDGEVLVSLAKHAAKTCDPEAIQIFEAQFKGERGVRFIEPFVQESAMLTHMLKATNDPRALRAIVTISLRRNDTLSVIMPYFKSTLGFILQHAKLLRLLRAQKDLSLLKPVVPVFIAAMLSKDANVRRDAHLLVCAICGVNVKVPAVYLDLVEVCDAIKFEIPPADIVSFMINRAEVTDMPTLVVLSILCQKQLLELDSYQEVLQYILTLLHDESEDVQAAVILCSSCFPLQLFY